MSAYLQLLEHIEKVAINKNASDIHIEPQDDNGYKIRIRIDGRLREIKQDDLILPEHGKHFFGTAKQRYGFDVGKLGYDQDSRFTNYALKYDFRCSLIPCTNRKPKLEKICIRLLPREKNFDLNSINFPVKTAIEHIKQALNKNNGMILLTGPTGSGKTTTTVCTLISAADKTLNTHTLEDPIEYSLSSKGINQTEIDENISFARGLRTLLRQDPDILMVGEIRDEETAKLALYASQTGHLLISTLHTNSAEDIFERMSEFGVKKSLIESNLILGTAQRLLSKNCTNCSDYSEEQSIILSHELSIQKKVKRGQGCEMCDHTGYSGRIFLFEYIRREIENNKIIFKKYGSMKEQAMKFLEEGHLDASEMLSIYSEYTK